MLVRELIEKLSQENPLSAVMFHGVAYAEDSDGPYAVDASTAIDKVVYNASKGVVVLS